MTFMAREDVIGPSEFIQLCLLFVLIEMQAIVRFLIFDVGFSMASEQVSHCEKSGIWIVSWIWQSNEVDWCLIKKWTKDVSI